jgi:hypothetical protein
MLEAKSEPLEAALLRFLVRLVLAATVTELLELKTAGGRLLVLRRRVITFLALSALQCHNFPHFKVLSVDGEQCPVINLFLLQRSAVLLPQNLFPVPCYFTISETVPAPTVRPPSRIANLKPFSRATGVISSICSDTLSPGITISTPSGNSATPVTSVVRK